MKKLTDTTGKPIPGLLSIEMLIVAAFLAGCGQEGDKRLSGNNPVPAESPQPPARSTQFEPVPPAAAHNVDASPTPPAAVAPAPMTNTAPAPTVQAPAPAANTAPAATKQYTVVRGDTLFKIARAHNVKITALSNANRNVDFAKLKAGQKIHIPAAPAPGAAGLGFKEPGHASSAAASDGSVHVVKAGETLTQIAKQRHTTAKAIQAANGLKTTRLLVGQKLRLPAAGLPAASNETAKPPGQPARSALAEM